MVGAVSGQKHQDEGLGGERPLTVSRLLPPGDPATIAQLIDDWGLWERPAVAAERPRVMLNMVMSADGHATLEGRSGPLSDSADRALFHGLRRTVDAILVGARTARTERYGRLIPDPASRALRAARGLAEEPLACVISGSLALGQDVPLLEEEQARVAILTASAASLPGTVAARVDYVRTRRDGRLDLRAALSELRERFSVQSVLCEGGPHLACQLLAADLVDELFLSVSPTLAGGSSQALRILAGEDLQPPVALDLLNVLAHDSSLFLRYGVSARERVSRATMPSSSLAS
jgi:riboflavin biosynthesis pyrimidine reductase